MGVAPASIKLAGGDNALTIHWSDGHLSTYPYRYLRRLCPCATCSELRTLSDPALASLPIFGEKPIQPERAELVGRYALQIHWSDGHSTGIYSFEFLRSICPCPECTSKHDARDSAPPGP